VPLSAFTIKACYKVTTKSHIVF